MISIPERIQRMRSSEDDRNNINDYTDSDVHVHSRIKVSNEICNMTVNTREVLKTTETYSEVSIIEKLPLEKNHTYLIIFLRTGQVQNNFYCTIILTYDLRSNT